MWVFLNPCQLAIMRKLYSAMIFLTCLQCGAPTRSVETSTAWGTIEPVLASFACTLSLPGDRLCTVLDVDQECCDALRASLSTVVETEDNVDWDDAQDVCGDLQPVFDCGDEQEKPACVVETEYQGEDVQCDFGMVTPPCCAATQIFVSELADESDLEPSAQIALSCVTDGTIFDALQTFDFGDCKSLSLKMKQVAECILEEYSCSLGEVSAQCCTAFRNEMPGNDPDPIAIARLCIHDLGQMRGSACFSDQISDDGLEVDSGGLPSDCVVDVAIGQHRLTCHTPSAVPVTCCRAYEDYLRERIDKGKERYVDNSLTLVTACSLDDIEVLTGMDIKSACIAEAVVSRQQKVSCWFSVDTDEAPVKCNLGHVDSACCSAVRGAKAVFINTVSIGAPLDSELFGSCTGDSHEIELFSPEKSCDIDVENR